jgi:hypothetical protein
MNVVAALCGNCGKNPVGGDLRCGFQDWCSECDDALWTTNPESRICCNCHQRPCGFADWCAECDYAHWMSKHVSNEHDHYDDTHSPHLPHIAKMLHPPYTWHFLEMVNEVMRMEKALRCAQHPQHVHDVIVDAQLLLCRMCEMGDCCLRPRVSHLNRRALVATLYHCHVLIRRCAELADACTLRFSHPELEPSYDVMAQAVLAADAVILYLHSDHKNLYLNEIRPTLVHCMQDSDSSMLETDSASDSDSDSETVPAKRVYTISKTN